MCICQSQSPNLSLPPRNLPKSGWKEIYEFIKVKFCKLIINFGNAALYCNNLTCLAEQQYWMKFRREFNLGRNDCISIYDDNIVMNSMGFGVRWALVWILAVPFHSFIHSVILLTPGHWGHSGEQDRHFPASVDLIVQWGYRH